MQVTAAFLPAPGRPATIQIGTADVPRPGVGEVRLAVRACGLNPVDAKLAPGGVPDWSWPHIPGLDIVGVVEAVGPDIDTDWIGRRVAVHHDLRRPGGLAGAVVVTAVACAPVPDGLDDATAAALPCPGLTAEQAVRRSAVTPGDRVLVVGAAGGVGTYAVQLAAAAGAEVTAVCSAADADRVRGLGAVATIDHHQGDLVAQGRAAGPFDIVLDLVGSSRTAPTLGLLAFNGRYASVARPDLSYIAPFTLAPTVVEIALGAAYTHGRDRDRAALGARLAELLGRDLVPPPVRVVPLAEAGAALQAILDGTARGKTVVRLAD